METIVIPENRIEMSLSEIFDYADKNMIHARWIFGISKYNCGCALGAVAFVLSNGKTTFPPHLKKIDPNLLIRYKYLKNEFSKRNNGQSLAFLNDFCMYSFKKLADVCRKSGL